MGVTDIRTFGSFVWSNFETLRGGFDQSEYGKITLPFVAIRRLDCILEGTIDAATSTASSPGEDMDDEVRGGILYCIVGKGIASADTGQVYVGAYCKSGTTDRRLDVIQEEMIAQWHEN